MVTFLAIEPLMRLLILENGKWNIIELVQRKILPIKEEAMVTSELKQNSLSSEQYTSSGVFSVKVKVISKKKSIQNGC